MIVPRERLLLWFGGVGLPLLAFGSLVPPLFGVLVAFAALLLAVAGIDALMSRGGLRAVAVEAPPVVRLTKGREGPVELRVRDAAGGTRPLRLGLPFPEEVRCEAPEQAVQLPAQGRRAVVSWSCTPLDRGSYPVRTCYLERPSRLGLWEMRGSVPVNLEVRAYPDLRSERRGVAAVFLNRETAGIHAHRVVGRGREFEKLREYIPGDSYEDIHWKATAKRGRPVTKVFQVERTQEVYVVLDASRLTARPSPTAPVAGTVAPTVLERFLTAALIFGLAAEQQGDQFGLVAFSDRVQRFVRARGGKAHFDACREALYALQPEIVSPDFDGVCSFIRLRLRRRALVVFLTSLDDPVLAESFCGAVDLIRGQHLVVVNMIQQPGVAPLFSEPDAEEVDHLYRRLAGHHLWDNLRELEGRLRSRGVAFDLLSDERLCTHLIEQYLRIKRRQAL